MLSESAITSMTVKKLRTRLKKRKQSVSDVKGKEELVQWLLSVAPLLPFPVDGSSAMAVKENNQPDNCMMKVKE